MQRVVILGPPGSGKSTLARRLGERLGVPAFHLDQSYWRAGWTSAPATEFRAEVERLSGLPVWVIDGNYSGTLATRLARADTLIYLDTPMPVSLWRVFRRAWRSRGRARPDMPEGCPEKFDPAFFWWTANWNRRNRNDNLARLAGFSGRAIRLNGTAAIERFLADIPA